MDNEEKLENKNSVQIICDDCSAKRLEQFQRDNQHRIAALERGDLVKVAFTEAGMTEHMWMMVADVEGDCVYGFLDNEPVLLSDRRFGDTVMALKSEIEDII